MSPKANKLILRTYAIVFLAAGALFLFTAGTILGAAVWADRDPTIFSSALPSGMDIPAELIDKLK
jgi:hypothetical protein